MRDLYKHTDPHICVCVYIYIYTHICYVYTCALSHTYIYIYIHICVYIYVYVHINQQVNSNEDDLISPKTSLIEYSLISSTVLYAIAFIGEQSYDKIAKIQNIGI